MHEIEPLVKVERATTGKFSKADFRTGGSAEGTIRGAAAIPFPFMHLNPRRLWIRK
jgi:hypothetical protein